MLYKEIIAVCSQIHTEHINTLCGQNIAAFIWQISSKFDIGHSDENLTNNCKFG